MRRTGLGWDEVGGWEEGGGETFSVLVLFLFCFVFLVLSEVAPVSGAQDGSAPERTSLPLWPQGELTSQFVWGPRDPQTPALRRGRLAGGKHLGSASLPDGGPPSCTSRDAGQPPQAWRSCASSLGLGFKFVSLLSSVSLPRD